MGWADPDRPRSAMAGPGGRCGDSATQAAAVPAEAPTGAIETTTTAPEALTALLGEDQA